MTKGGPFTPAALWPTTKRSMKYLIPTSEQAFREGRGLLLKREPNAAIQVVLPGTKH